MGEFMVWEMESSSPVVLTGTVTRGSLRLGARAGVCLRKTGAKLEVNLTLSGIEVYRKMLDDVSEGWSARLYLSGSGGDGLQRDDVIYFE